MTMIAIVLSPDFCVVASDRAVGELNNTGVVATQNQSTKIEYFTNEPMPFVATCSGLSQAVHLIPQLISVYPINSRGDINGLTNHVGNVMRQTIPQRIWSSNFTTTYVLALTPDNHMFFHAYHLDDNDLLASYDVENIFSMIPSGFEPQRDEIRKEYWRAQLSTAIAPNTGCTQTQRLEAVLEALQGAFQECSTLNHLVSSNFDYCVINQSDRSITFNDTPSVFS